MDRADTIRLMVIFMGHHFDDAIPAELDRIAGILYDNGIRSRRQRDVDIITHLIAEHMEKSEDGNVPSKVAWALVEAGFGKVEE